MVMRPVLVGMNNPISSDPQYALYPRPDGCTGNRIWLMLNQATLGGVTAIQYRNRFDRVNVLHAREWSVKAARESGRVLLPVLDQARRTVLIFGAQTKDALGLEVVPPLQWVERRDGCRWAWAPHPSGRNYWYNDQENRFRVAFELARLYNG